MSLKTIQIQLFHIGLQSMPKVMLVDGDSFANTFDD